MDKKVCAFFGHRDIPERIKPILTQTLTELIEKQNAAFFYVGNQGGFDSMVLSVLRELEKIYPITYQVVLAYLPKNKDLNTQWENALFPEGMESVHPKFAIDRRNRWMVQNSDMVVTYVRRPGGAAKYKELAAKQGKTVIELSEKE